LAGEKRINHEYDLEAITYRIAKAARLVGSKKKLAELIGVSEVQLYRYLNMENAPSIEVAFKIAQACGVRLEWLLTGLERPTLLTSSAFEKVGAHIKNLESFGWPINRISKATNIPKAELIAILDGHQQPTIDIIFAISDKTPISLDYLLTGINPPFKGSLPLISSEYPNELNDEYTAIALFDNQNLDSQEPQEDIIDRSPKYPALFNKRWITHSLKCSPKDLMFMNVNEYSMSPTISTNDAILIDKRHINHDASEGIFLLKYKSGIVLRRIKHFQDGKTSIGGDNPHCENAIISSEHFRKNIKIIGKVVWYGHIS
jgi:transcriptional regulator with XRE-family HTH domain